MRIQNPTNSALAGKFSKNRSFEQEILFVSDTNQETNLGLHQKKSIIYKPIPPICETRRITYADKAVKDIRGGTHNMHLWAWRRDMGFYDRKERCWIIRETGSDKDNRERGT